MLTCVIENPLYVIHLELADFRNQLSPNKLYIHNSTSDHIRYYLDQSGLLSGAGSMKYCRLQTGSLCQYYQRLLGVIQRLLFIVFAIVYSTIEPNLTIEPNY